MGWMRATCREAARWMSARRDEPLGLWRGLGLKLHLHLCGDCREVERQMEQIGAWSADALSGAALDDTLPDKERVPPQR